MKRVLFVSHCILNTASKVTNISKQQPSPEEILRKKFVVKAIEENIQLIQLPCPEFTLYGSKRWGHTKDQFDNVFFRTHCRKILQPIIEQMAEYQQNPQSFEIIGVVGIEGSPSCGVSVTYRGDWGGELSGHPDLGVVVSKIHREQESGVLIDVLREMLYEIGLFVKIIGLNGKEPEATLAILD